MCGLSAICLEARGALLLMQLRHIWLQSHRAQACGKTTMPCMQGRATYRDGAGLTGPCRRFDRALPGCMTGAAARGGQWSRLSVRAAAPARRHPGAAAAAPPRRPARAVRGASCRMQTAHSVACAIAWHGSVDMIRRLRMLCDGACAHCLSQANRTR